MIDIRVCFKTGYPQSPNGILAFSCKNCGLVYTGIPHFTNEFISLDRHTCDGHARVSQRNPMTGIERKVGPGLVCSKAATDLIWSGFQHIIWVIVGPNISNFSRWPTWWQF